MRKGSGTFFIGMVLDIKHQGIGCLIGWGIWFIMFVLLLIDRHKREL
jgi:high-affinity Fe2+/Pb2+ permease